MYKSNCMYCARSELLRSFAIQIVELEQSIVYLHRDSKYKGRCIVALKEHKRELFELSEQQRNQYIREVSNVARAVKTAFNADKINYAVYGDIMDHLHFHIVPKRKSGTEWGKAFEVVQATPSSMSEEEIKRCCEKILENLEFKQE
ncbi:HIT family protein [bacterium]|nr:HIT family protein [bacterium]